MQNLKLEIIRTWKKDGKIVKVRKKQSRSFVKAWLQLIEMALAHPYNTASDSVNITDTSNTARACSWATEDAQTHWALEAPVSNTNYGVLIGTGTTAPATADYGMETLIAEGAGAGQMNYAATSVLAAGVSGANMEMEMTRAIVNNSGGSITVKEVGLVVQNATTWYFLIVRDAVNDAVSDGQTYTITYKFTTTV